jgi:hypothetical protein
VCAFCIGQAVHLLPCKATSCFKNRDILEISTKETKKTLKTHYLDQRRRVVIPVGG